MFSRAQVILGKFARSVEKNNAIPQEEVEYQESIVFHTFGDLDQYKDVLFIAKDE